MEELSGFLRNFWVVWMMALFIGIVAWAFWPSRRRRDEMRDHAQIPFRDDAAAPGGSQHKDR
jgi:cytochrome c oxidase cbb3-type subunit 4